MSEKSGKPKTGTLNGMLNGRNLADFVEGRPRRHRKWIDHLPDDVVTQILESDAGPSVVTAWLVSLGYEDCTRHKIDPLITQRRNGE